ncbi:hypothetical protein K493DRAFT_299660 [Basidiobolus meristosporus CBS 931.73]|uniref:Anaphase-promoting complex subunit 4 n=1 Tax=Basidiobolus meristosporus CBS 931.73 TaxID=1314790 RepID=A0A1Y1YLK1_9FUNG|nr:hypothetical protein K493DRAFT_299660 [Basidiobolus meristosporus CBS 931.73]|eukprot:ORX98889.1 hypothetical protein K493DRAFT_299660 [Basidiobolus meristosporus CBS 931.73]
MVPDAEKTFTPLGQKRLPEAVCFYSWCPTMDLIALITYTGELSLWRLSWQKVWSVSHTGESKPTALTWRPDGKVLAVGYPNCTVSLYDVSSAQILHKIQLSNSEAAKNPISFLYWAEEAGNAQGNQSSINSHSHIVKHLPQLSAIPHNRSSGSIFATKPKDTALDMFDESEKDSDTINLLIAADDFGNIYTSVYGVFDLGSKSTEKYAVPEAKKFRAIEGCASHDLSVFTLVYSSLSDPNGDSKLGCSFSISFDTGLLHSRKREIRSLSSISTKVSFLLNYIQQSIKGMEEEYLGVTNLSKKHLERLEQILIDQGVDSNPVAEFANMLAKGSPSVCLNQFMQQDLTEKGLRKWEKTTENGFIGIRSFAHEYVQPACIRLILYLDEIAGLSRWEERYTSIGLHEETVHSCVMLVGNFVGRLEELLLTIDAELKKFLNFTKWLQNVLQKIMPTEEPVPIRYQPVDILKVAEFLQTSLTNDCLAGFFSKMSQNSMARYLEELEKRNNTKRASCLYPHSFTFPKEILSDCDLRFVSVRDLFQVLDGRCKQLLDVPAKLIGDTFQQSRFTLLQSQCVDFCCATEFGKQGHLLMASRGVHEEKATYEYLALHSLPGSNENECKPTIWIVRTKLSTESTQRSDFVGLSIEEPGATLLDMEFFDDQSLAVLMQRRDENEQPACYLELVEFRELDYTTGTASFEDSSILELCKMKIHPTRFTTERARNLKVNQANGIVTNGRESRRIIGVLSSEQKDICVFDIDNDEEEEEEEEDEEE